MLIPEKQFNIIKVIPNRATVEQVASLLKTTPSSLMRDLIELERKGLVKIEREFMYEIKISNEGLKYLTKGLPEERLLDLILKAKRIKSSLTVSELSEVSKSIGIDISNDEIRIGLNHLLRRRVCRLTKGRIIIDEEKIDEFKKQCEKIKNLLKLYIKPKYEKNISNELKELKRRKLINIKEKRIIYISRTTLCTKLINEGKLIAAKVVTKLTPELITSGKWKEVIFKEFDLSIEVPTVYPCRKHPYMELLDEIRDLLASMGFEEIKGPHVELEFWNFDVLFQAQDHPAREIHDTFFLKFPKYGNINDRELMERVRKTHENGWITGSKGWRYKWDPRRALRLILRTQTTAVSVRTLYERGEGEYRCFSLDRVFRPETLDPKHSMEFYQLEGIIVGKNVTFRHLLGFFVEFARKLGLGKVKIKPAYFPFTEPSVEGFIKHPKLGWIEVFPGGMFRPEVLYPLGIKKCNVAAWGIGIDRIAMTILGIDDIRLLFTPDIDFLRKTHVPLIKNIMR